MAYLLCLAAAEPVLGCLGAFRGGVLGWVAWGALVPLAVYLALVVLTTLAFRPDTAVLTGLGVVASHIAYGVQFVRGLCARKAPCEFIGKDHAGGR